jgi:hypothetical protein
MKGLSLILVLLLLANVLIAGCMENAPVPAPFRTVLLDFQEPLGSVCTSPALKVLKSSGLDQDHCYQQLAVNTNQLSLCSKIVRGAPMTKCYMLIAAKENEMSICRDIPATSDTQAYLPLDCLYEVATVNRNREACEEMGTKKISRMFIGEISRETCLAKVGGI